MRENMTHAIEDYLKTIYELTTCCERATTNKIAEALGITPASVTGMLKKLANTEPPLIVYERHRGAFLTSSGKQIALEILRHHRLLEMYLHQMLGYQWDEVHDEADRLEHVISEEFEGRIDQALGHPTRDPHGDPIPTSDLQMPDADFVQLADLQPGQSAIIQRVGNTNPELLRYLKTIGLIPLARVQILDYSPFDENLSLSVQDRKDPTVLGPAITHQIYVEVVE